MRGSQTLVYRALSSVHRDLSFLSITHLLPAAFMGLWSLEDQEVLVTGNESGQLASLLPTLFCKWKRKEFHC